MHVRATQTGMHGLQNHKSVGNGQSQDNQCNVIVPMRIPQFVGQAAYGHGNPPASAETSTQNAAEVA